MANILVCDDAAFMRMMLRRILEKNNHTIIGEAADGEEAIVKYKELNPDLVIMDITMPVKTGLESIKEILEFDAAAKVIMCSAMGQQTFVLDAIKAGAKDFIVKPFFEDRVIAAINSAIN